MVKDDFFIFNRYSKSIAKKGMKSKQISRYKFLNHIPTFKTMIEGVLQYLISTISTLN